ncbi:DUF4105 domain-containing protein [Spongiibacter sp. KMU-158]|uniref:DUF4105 domain-containing protein n=1 Tax=Spongiibacter pelagi TaxID=2760804 RepID=A0A927C4Q5_9GAMM|nr:DUF4105 domain-containing protein [Spongiibacter pelagi]
MGRFFCLGFFAVKDGMGKVIKSLAVFLIVIVAGSASAAEQAMSMEHIAQSRAWQTLLHMPRSGGPSYIRDPRFFLAENGSVDPFAELQATLAAFKEQPELACFYPARRQFLQQAGLMSGTAEPVCEEFDSWRSKLDVQRMVLVLASSYLNSPSSMYGHTFLRLDPAGERSASPYLSYALNFGARIPAGENGLLYAYKGIFGGYPGVFSLQPYYEKIQEYTRLENRDMWEYELDLN